jgi:hypothetical protein
MKIEEAIYRVKDKAANGTPSESNRIRDRRVMSAINTAYHHIIKEEIKQKMYIPSEKTYIHLPCIEMEDAPISDCDCIKIKLCTSRRSKHKLPKILSLNGKDYIENISVIDGSSFYSYTGFQSAKRSAANKFAANFKVAYIKNDYLYTIGDNFDVVSADIIPSDITEAIEFNSLCTKKDENGEDANCFDFLEQELSIELSYMHRIIDMAAKEIINKIEEDNISNQTNKL